MESSCRSSFRNSPHEQRKGRFLIQEIEEDRVKLNSSKSTKRLSFNFKMLFTHKISDNNDYGSISSFIFDHNSSSFAHVEEIIYFINKGFDLNLIYKYSDMYLDTADAEYLNSERSKNPSYKNTPISSYKNPKCSIPICKSVTEKNENYKSLEINFINKNYITPSSSPIAQPRRLSRGVEVKSFKSNRNLNYYANSCKLSKAPIIIKNENIFKNIIIKIEDKIVEKQQEIEKQNKSNSSITRNNFQIISERLFNHKYVHMDLQNLYSFEIINNNAFCSKCRGNLSCKLFN
jgi:hypothetical protein